MKKKRGLVTYILTVFVFAVLFMDLIFRINELDSEIWTMFGFLLFGLLGLTLELIIDCDLSFNVELGKKRN